jgi:Tol biopolymer transport system component
MIGKTLAHYKITAALGAGGMGEVWRAIDTRLDREVALKLLPEEFAKDPDRMARFEREAKVLASLNHPNIATLYGLESAIPSGTETETGTGQATFLVMELVEGEGLSERIKHGSIPVDEAIPIALQIAEGLEAAHEHGIVHRDLKPANIQLTPEGVVKILDFGLARTWGGDDGDSSLSMSPTITKNATAAGMILGTAAYMSPEQARGKKVDRRTDIWAFGVVLWEMITGRRLFEGETVSDILAAVLRADPDWEELPAATPRALRRLLERCLARDPRSRLHDVADARLELEAAAGEPFDEELVGEQVVGVGTFRRWLPWASAAVLAVFLVLSRFVFQDPSAPGRPIAAAIPLPAGTAPYYTSEYEGSFAVSPDGRLLVFSAALKDEEPQLWVRPLGSAEADVLQGTGQGSYPFWSPDNRWIAFFADEKLKKVGLTGSPPEIICNAPHGRPGAWNDEDVILFSPDTISGIHRVPASGGDPQLATVLDKGRGETTHRWASFLPDGRHFLYLAGVHDLREDAAANALYVGDLESDLKIQLIALRSPAVFDSGHLLYVRDGVLVAHPFAPARLEFIGDPISVANDVAYDASYFQARFAAANGVLVYRQEDQAMGASLAWFGRDGVRLQEHGGSPLPVIEPAPKKFVADMSAALSPDESRLMCMLANENTGALELWIAELDTGLWTRFSQTSQTEAFPAWSPDGDRVVFSRALLEGTGFELIEADVDGSSGETQTLFTDRYVWPSDWSRDGSHLLFTEAPSAGLVQKSDIWVLPMNGEGDREPYPFLQTQHNEYGGWFSPDGKWVLYISDESGISQAYVRPFPGPGVKRQVSNDPAVWGWWRTPSEVLLMSPDGTVYAVEVNISEGKFRAGASESLIDLRPVVVGEPSHDGSRFIVAVVPEEARGGGFNLLVNWTQGLRQPL